MENAFDTMRAAVEQAAQVQRAADDHAHAMARMLLGRLRYVGPVVLAELKRELRDFNIHTGEWKP